MIEVNFVVTPSWVYVYNTKKINFVDKLLDFELRSRNPQAFWQNKRRKEIHSSIPLIDNYWHLYDKDIRRFPKGVFKKAALCLLENKFDVKIVTDKISYKPNMKDLYFGHGLKDFWWQNEATNKFFDSEFAVCGIRTRGGKSIVGLRVATAFVKNCSVLYLVNKTEAQRSIINHWKNNFNTTDVFDDITKNNALHVLTYQAANNRDISHVGMVIGDEIHGVGATTFFNTMIRCESAWYRLGLTGTYQGRSDGKDLWIEAACGPVYYEVERQTIIDAGLCARGEVWTVPVNQSIIEDVKGWKQIESQGIINRYRNERLIQCALAANKKLNDSGQILVMVHKHEHGKQFSEQLSSVLNIEVPYISSKTQPKLRKKYYEDIQSGKLKAAVASSIWNDSVTLPHVKVLVIAPGGKSPIRTRQILGRALTGDKDVIIVDALDRGHKTLLKHSHARKKAYEDDGYKVKIWEPKKNT